MGALKDKKMAQWKSVHDKAMSGWKATHDKAKAAMQKRKASRTPASIPSHETSAPGPSRPSAPSTSDSSQSSD